MDLTQNKSERGAGTRSVAVSKLTPNYGAWLRSLVPGIELTDFDKRSPAEFVTRAGSFSGLLLTGGGDIHPGLYGNADHSGHCLNIDKERDDLECRMFEAALAEKLPVLAICRGLQIMNIVLGGTLFTDIPTFMGTRVLHKDLKKDVYHGVEIAAGSLLQKITDCEIEIVNSSHHQAADRLATGLAVSALSADGIVEAVEYKDSGIMCIGVQWHPERMDINNPLSGKLGTRFLEGCL